MDIVAPIDDGAEIQISVERVRDLEVPWPVLKLEPGRHFSAELRRNMDDLTFGFILAEAFAPAGPEAADLSSPAAVIQKFILEDELNPPEPHGAHLLCLMPGLKVVASDQREISSGCCCCLSDWRDWYKVLDGSGGPSLGHSPSPGVINEAGAILVLSDVDSEPDAQPPFGIRLTSSRYRAELDRVQAELQAFLARVHEWVTRFCDQESADRVVRRFDFDANISADFRSY